MTSFKDKVIYEIYPKSFQDSNGDGWGDLRGVTKRLDYLKELISPQNDNGYDVENYREIDPRYGTMEDLEELIHEADQRGIGLMLDMVFNHTSTAHEWFQRAMKGEKKYQDYYIFKEGTEDQLPTNWESKFGGPAWEYVPSLRKWYLHLYDVSQADLNWENPEVRKELKEVIRFWKEKGIKGFRFDVVNVISKPEKYEDDTIGDGRRFYTDGRHVHEFIKELVRDTGIEDMVTVGEMSSTSLENCIRYSNPEEKELSMCFNFHHLKIDYRDGQKWELMEPDLKAMKNLFRTWQEGMQEKNGWNALFWCNHDQPRIVSRLGNEEKYWKESAKMLAGAIHLMQGTPYIYQGEELGMTNAHFTSIDQYMDVESRNYFEILRKNGKSEAEALHILAERSRDNARTPMQWTNSENAGFTDGQPWIEVQKNYDKVSVIAEENDDTSILAFYKKLIVFRKQNLIISHGTIRFLDEMPEAVMGYEREWQEKKMVVLCNFKEEEVWVSYKEEWKDYGRILGNYEGSKEEEEFSAQEGQKELKLRAYEFVVIGDK